MLNLFETQYNEYKQAVSGGYVKHRIDLSRSRAELRIKYQEYDEGLQDTKLTDRQKAFLNVQDDHEFNFNYCTAVLNAKADRLKVTGISIPDAKNESPQETMWKWWRKNRMDRKQNIVHRMAGRDADAYVLVSWDSVANIPRFHVEPAFTGDGVEVYYSDEHRDDIEFASKTWRINYGTDTGKMRRMNLYFPNRIEKYVSHDGNADGNWLPYEDEDTDIVGQGRMGIAGISWWTTDRTEDGDPLGMPIVHFKNNDTGDCYGTSDLQNVIPVQDALNKSVIDLLAVMDTEGFGLLVGTGTDTWAQTKVAPGAIAAVNVPSSQADLKRLEGSNPAGLLAVKNDLVMEIGRVSGTPLSYFQTSGQVAAEGTMKQQEIALVSRVKKAQTDFGNSWEDVFNIGRRLHNTFSTEAPLDEDELIDTVWEQAESRNEKEQAETLSIKVSMLGVSEDQAQIEMGYGVTERDAFKKAKLQAQAMAIRNAAKMGAMNPQAGQQNMTQTENANDNANGNTQVRAAAA
jgi:hypothetical protein